MQKVLVAAIVSLFALASAGVVLTVWATQPPDAMHAVHDEPAGADERLLHHGMAGDFDHDGDGHPDTGMERPAFAPATGSVPDESAAQTLDEVSRLVIRSDDDFTPANGVRSGNGTLEDPYMITGYHVTGDLYIADTDACFIVAGNYIGGQLSLNWNGQCVHAHHNFIRDLRVNENIHRTGYATGGLIEQNKISFLGQLRHYDGEFRHNVVGPFAPGDIFDRVLETVELPWTTQVRVANVDGFNQGLLHHNTFHGSVDLDLHGHHHGTGFFAPHSHYHGSDEDRSAAHDHDHTDRWTSVSFTDNKIVDAEGYGLRYDDIAHAGDDRTANSEDEMELREDHRHHTWVTIARNTVEGAGIWIDVFNADDELHHTRNPGWLDVIDNTVVLHERDPGMLAPLLQFQYQPNVGIDVAVAKEVELALSGNSVRYVPLDESERDPVTGLVSSLWAYEEPAAGIRLFHMSDANVTIEGNTLQDFTHGIAARHLEDDVVWTLRDNLFSGVAQEVWYDDSVANEPTG